MSAIAPQRKGWCPGALRPMETGDGLIARVRASRGRLSLDQAAALAESALRCGNGAIGLSARGNLHLRGLSEPMLPGLHARLADVGLIDADPETERLRNIVSSPLDDVDPDALLDLGPSVAAIETRLGRDRDLRALPAKFSFVFDALGRLPLGDVEADIRFEAAGKTLAVFLAGEDALAAECAPGLTGEIAVRLGRAFVRLAGEEEGAPRRMRALVERRGAGPVFSEAALEAKPRRRSVRRISLGDLLGVQEYGGRVVVGAAAAFGEIEASRFLLLIERARMLGASGLRLTPSRAFLILGLDEKNARAMLGSIAKLGFIVNADEPRLRIAACPGAPACMHGHRAVREDAARWAALIPKGEGIVLHVSGCPKGCARAAATALTLTATESGYDLILAGKAADPPARRALPNTRVEELLGAESARIFAGEGP
jgi:precorrin-3B synthase